MTDRDLAELLSPAQVLTNYPNLVTRSSLAWQLRHRHENGLAAAGAVLELRQRPDQKRPKILIRPSRYAAVIHEQHKYLRRPAGVPPRERVSKAPPPVVNTRR